MSKEELRSLLEVSVDGTPMLIEAARILATEAADTMQRNPTSMPPFGWLLGSSEGLEVWHLGFCMGGRVGPPAGGGAVLVVERPNGERWGLFVERIADTVEVPSSAVHDLGSVLGKRAFSALAETPTGPRLVLDLDRLHPDDVSGVVVEMPPAAAVAATAVESPQRMIWIPTSDGDAAVGLSARQIVEIREPLATAPMPSSSGPLVGIGLVDGGALPVVDSGWIIDPSTPPTTAKRLLVARASRSGRRVVLLVPADIRMIDLPVANRPLGHDGSRAPWIRGVFDVDDGVLFVPDLDAMMA